MMLAAVCFFRRDPCAKRLAMTDADILRDRDSQAPEALADQMRRAELWFAALRDEICAALEALEDALPSSALLSDSQPGRFVRKAWERTDHTGAPGGGGVMSTLRGRVFE